MSNPRMSTLQPWVIRHPLIGRSAAALVILAFPFVAAFFCLWLSLKGVAQGLIQPWKDAWGDWGWIKKDLAVVAATAFRRWENDL